MKNINLFALLILIFTSLQCTKDDQIRVETDTTTVPDNTNVSFLIQVVDEVGNPLEGAVLTNTPKAITRYSDQRGLIQLNGLSIPADGLPVIIELDGWMKQVKLLRGRSNSRSSIRLEMHQFEMETVFTTGSTGAISQNGRLSLPSFLKKSDGSNYTGAVLVKSRYYNPTESGFLEDAPGDMSAIGVNGELYTLQSYGMYAVELFDESGNELSIPDGQTAKLEFPVPNNYGSIPNEVPLWSMDENTGKWVEEGIAFNKGNYLEAEVSHFSWWNCDIPFDPTEVCMSLVDQEGIALSGFTYLISSPDQQIAYFFGQTDIDGNLCASVPIGQSVSISVWLGEDLSQPLELGTFNTATDLGTVTIAITLISINGKVVDCEGAAIDGALVWYQFNGETSYTLTDDDGLFNLVFLLEGTLDLQAIDQENTTQSPSVSLSLASDPGSYDIGDLQTCDSISPGQPIVVLGDITTDAIWTSGKIYILAGHTTVVDGVTLTIQPGTVIKGLIGEGVNSSALIIARGGKLMAEGTPEAPIIFTSIADEITPDDIAVGNFGSPNLNSTHNGLWGGVILLGRALISVDSVVNTGEMIIEGLSAFDNDHYYGGDDEFDNSGVLRYVSIRHGGTNIGEGNEINGLTLAGVGSGTTIDHIEIVGCRDDGIEWFGGNVNVSNVVVWQVGDDAIDTDQAWGGTLDNFVVITPGGNCFELDGPEGSYEARHTIQNGTIVAVTSNATTGGSLIDVDNYTPVDLKNLHFIAPLEGLTITEDEVANTTFENVTFDVNPQDLPALMEQGGAIPAGISAGGSPVANVSIFFWTWTAQAGGLDGL
ncbi:MAG TPA: carboxypeptidase-like regulatory domain-containing protein [Saprospiraceae bacterium]|nr:carboxypeptidase-like regulatory domain-containing protein [Saprospiraceae bacterium]HMQ81254.1 carboxypeptidase-like regulatory domain-containing protein [Saprospiraceae bacterium]